MEKYAVGQLILQFRQREGLTQAELAAYIHVSQPKLAHWEEGLTIPGQYMVRRLIGALRLSDEDAASLWSAVKAAQEKKAKFAVEKQEILNAESAERKRLKHKCNLRSPTATGAVVNGHSAVRQRPA